MVDKPQEANEQEVLTDTQREKLDTLRRVLRIQIDGDWDDVMINTAFSNLERLLFRLENDEPPEANESGNNRKSSRRSGSSARRRGRRN